MAEEEIFQIRLSAAMGGESKNVTIAELGVLLTGINRALNKFGGSASWERYSAQSQEPVGIRSEILRVENGSIILSVASTISQFVDQNVIQAGFLAGIFGNAAWDFTKLLNNEIARALRRVGNEVRQESTKIDPVLEIDQGLNVNAQDERGAVSSQRHAVQVQIGAERTLLPQKTKYSVIFEQQGIPRIEITFSAVERE